MCSLFVLSLLTCALQPAMGGSSPFISPKTRATGASGGAGAGAAARSPSTYPHNNLKSAHNHQPLPQYRHSPRPNALNHSYIKNASRPPLLSSRSNLMSISINKPDEAKQYFPSSHNMVPLQTSSRAGKVWSERVDLPNPLINNWHMLLKNVSYFKGVLYIHVPEDSATIKAVAGVKSLYKFQLVHTQLDMSTCSTVETRTVTHVFPGWSKNSFITNMGHLLINVINPLFRYLFFVHNQLPNLTNGSMVPNHQLPLSNTLLLMKADDSLQKPPVFLFDMVLRFASSYMPFRQYFEEIKPGEVHCFDSIDVPIYDTINRLHPEKGDVAVTYGIWDSMHWTHKGRWGNNDFYYNFWRHVKQQIWQLYDIMPRAVVGIPTISPQESSKTLNVSERGVGLVVSSQNNKPKLAFMARQGGSVVSRSDGNINAVVSVLQSNFDVSVLTNDYYVWYEHNASMRFGRVRKTLLKVQDMDILIGQSGSNNQLALFMKEGKMNVEIKNYNPCSNEAGKALANHNRLAFHTVMILDIANIPNKSPAMYTHSGLTKLSAELLSAWHSNVKDAEHESRLDSWPSTCDFLWPTSDPKIRAKSKVLTRSNVSRCYLEQVAGRGWYQLTKHKNSMVGKCYDPNVPYETSLIYCMVRGVC